MSSVWIIPIFFINHWHIYHFLNVHLNTCIFFVLWKKSLLKSKQAVSLLFTELCNEKCKWRQWRVVWSTYILRLSPPTPPSILVRPTFKIDWKRHPWSYSLKCVFSCSVCNRRKVCTSWLIGSIIISVQNVEHLYTVHVYIHNRFFNALNRITF